MCQVIIFQTQSSIILLELQMHFLVVLLIQDRRTKEETIACDMIPTRTQLSGM